MNIVLDMDQTLIDGTLGNEHTKPKLIARPHLDLFLEWCFDTFKNVSIWTAANEVWFEHVNEKIFKPILEELSEKNSPTNPYNFGFIFTSKKCSNAWRFSEWHGHPFRFTEKRLRKIHRLKSFKFKDYTLSNTLIVDDTKSTFACNYGNGIHISPFETDEYTPNWSDDKQLLRLLIYIRNVVIPHYNKYKTIRNLEKRYWMSYIRELEENILDSSSETDSKEIVCKK